MSLSEAFSDRLEFEPINLLMFVIRTDTRVNTLAAIFEFIREFTRTPEQRPLDSFVVNMETMLDFESSRTLENDFYSRTFIRFILKALFRQIYFLHIFY